MADDDEPTFKPTSAASGKPNIGLNLSAMAEGDMELKATDFLTTARASNEVAITVRGNAKVKAKRILQLLPAILGKERCKAGWRPKGSQIAVACVKDGNCILSLYSRKQMPKPVEVHNLGPGTPTCLAWDGQGTSLAVMVVRSCSRCHRRSLPSLPSLPLPLPLPPPLPPPPPPPPPPRNPPLPLSPPLFRPPP
jgi:hypothetical protein